MIVVPIVLVGYLIIWIVFKQLEKTLTGNIIIGVLVLGVGIFMLVTQQLWGLFVIIIAVLYLLIYIVPAVRRPKLNKES